MIRLHDIPKETDRILTYEHAVHSPSTSSFIVHTMEVVHEFLKVHSHALNNPQNYMCYKI